MVHNILGRTQAVYWLLGTLPVYWGSTSTDVYSRADGTRSSTTASKTPGTENARVLALSRAWKYLVDLNTRCIKRQKILDDSSPALAKSNPQSTAHLVYFEVAQYSQYQTSKKMLLTPSTRSKKSRNCDYTKPVVRY